MKEGWSKQSGTRQRGPYAHSAASKQWVGYDDVEAVARKADYIQERGYGGAAVWTLDLDDFNNLCCQGESCQYCQCCHCRRREPLLATGGSQSTGKYLQSKISFILISLNDWCCPSNRVDYHGIMPKYLMILLLSHFHFPLVSSNLTPTLTPTDEPWLCSAGYTH